MVSTSISCIKQPTIYSELEKFTTKTVQLMEIYNKTVGDYPYKQYSVIQGGDGGMEYAMCNDLGQGTFEGLLGVTARNGAFMVPACVSFESKHGWMDEDLLHFGRFWTGRD
jgi:hypothetical protein